MYKKNPLRPPPPPPPQLQRSVLMFLTVTDHFVFKHQYNDKLRSLQLQMHNNVTQKLYITYVHANKLFRVVPEISLSTVECRPITTNSHSIN